MPVTSVQAAIVAAITAIVGLLVGFAIIDERTAGVVVAASATLVASAFVVANAVIHHGISTKR